MGVGCIQACLFEGVLCGSGEMWWQVLWRRCCWWVVERVLEFQVCVWGLVVFKESVCVFCKWGLWLPAFDGCVWNVVVALIFVRVWV